MPILTDADLGRLWAKLDKNGSVPEHCPDLGPCWLWTDVPSKDGYGYLGLGGRAGGKFLAHRLVYEIAIGPIPAGMDLDHLCRVRRCANPSHLEPVTRRVNLLRGDTRTARNAAVVACPRGHPYDEHNTGYSGAKRHCRNKREFRKDRSTHAAA